ncbi:hypothetical protein BSL82_05845 [Tardibacter chloracetimidivorans]|uniref:Uncharacterized protein n=1 Tax=Tardibacter chloracetimidivorans TaxID=1921510 RepID=A0A1L3ZTC5_9SPHN|nr:hypothetical protein [Tardibacter chloracetimidivorans]API58892.1 hypothetical protein BSL82_05845 [Tardibacter chloracetimidivorans]
MSDTGDQHWSWWSYLKRLVAEIVLVLGGLQVIERFFAPVMAANDWLFDHPMAFLGLMCAWSLAHLFAYYRKLHSDMDQLMRRLPAALRQRIATFTYARLTYISKAKVDEAEPELPLIPSHNRVEEDGK